MIFPGIVSKICPGDCMKSCVRGRRTGDHSVDLKALEQSCVEHTAKQKPARYTILKKPQKAAVIGAGLSGLACAYRMASYGYSVTVYEMAQSIGGSVLSELDPEVCQAEFEKAFGVVDCEFVLGTRVTNLAEIQADAIYIATGKDGDDFGHFAAGGKESDFECCIAGEDGDDFGHFAAGEKESDFERCTAGEGGAGSGGLVCGNSPGVFLAGHGGVRRRTTEKGAPAAGIGRKTEENRKNGRTRIRVLDPCAAAGNDGMANAVRQLLRNAGYSLLDGNEQPDPACCGFGGHIYPAVPAVCDAFAKRRVEGETEICGVYCANCRDAYVHGGADARHVLELILGETKRCAALPELDERRENRRRLKRIFTGQPEPKEETGMKIEIPVQLIDKMDRELILREQVHAVIEEAEETGKKVYDPEQDIYYAHQRFGYATVWAGYQVTGDGVLVTSVYCHRVEVEESL